MNRRQFIKATLAGTGLASSFGRAEDKAAPAELLSYGLVDVTAPPFNADPGGRRDSTEVLQNAIDFAQQNHKVAFFPPGTYKISDTLECRHLPPPPGVDRGRFEAGRYWGITLLGSRSTARRPRIVLAPESPGFDDKAKPKLVLYYHQGPPNPDPPEFPRKGPSFMNSRLIGIDIAIGNGNPGAVALRMRGAQGMGVEDVTIDATHGMTGLEGGNGSGGGNTNVTIIGGDVGFDGSATQPTPSITGFRFINQKKHAILYTGRHALNATGISVEAKRPITAVKANDVWTREGGTVGDQEPCWNGAVNFVDCEIRFTGAPGTAFDSNGGVYLNNCFVHNAGVLVRHMEGGDLPGKRGAWMHIKEFAQTYDMRPYMDLKYSCPIYIDSKRQTSGIANVVPNSEPPADLLTRHIWSDDFPSWEDKNAVNVKKPPFSAKGDGVTDDTAVIQKAIDEHEIVFVPAGLYRVSKTIDLKSNTKLIGLMPNLTGLIVVKPEGDFSDPADPKPILRTPDDPDGTAVLAFIGTWTNEEHTSYNLLWRVGRKSTIRDWMVMHRTMQVPERIHESVVVTGGGGGRWYNYYDETYSLEYRAAYRHLCVKGTKEPFRIYQCNPEHARSEANMEILDAENVTLYGVKGEGNYPIVRIRNSRNIRIFGYGGNAPPMPDTSLFLIENSEDIILANLFNQVRLHKGGYERFGGINVDPTLWHAVIERFQDGREFKTPPLERPVLYQHGTPKDIW